MSKVSRVHFKDGYGQPQSLDLVFPATINTVGIVGKCVTTGKEVFFPYHNVIQLEGPKPNE